MSAALVPITRDERNASAKAIKAVRHAHDLTQAQLGKISGTSKELVCRWEKQGAPSVWIRLGRIADALGCSADEVLGRTVPERTTDAIGSRERRFLDAARDHVLALYGEDIVGRSGGWLTVAEIAFLGFLHGRRDQDLLRPDNRAPYVEEAAAKHRVACHRAAHRGQPLPRYIPPAQTGAYGLVHKAAPEPGFTRDADGRLWPKGYFQGWESPRQASARMNLSVLATTNAELQMLLAATESKALPVPNEHGQVMSAREAAQRLGIYRDTMVRWIHLGLVRGARKMGNTWSVPGATVEALAAARRPRLTAGATP